MNSFTSAAISLALVMAVSAVSKEDLPHNDFFSLTRNCVPSQRFVDICNECKCSPDGKGAACTLMACQPPVQPRIDGFSSEGLSCPPGQKFFDNCNACTCSQNGKSAICTLAADCNVHARSRRSVEQQAPVARPNYPHIDNFSQSKECTPGAMFYEECNSCHCSADGKSAGCTLMACPGYDKIRIDNYVQGKKCPAGKTFYDKCNSCTCSADGLSAACTLIACPAFE